MSVKLVSHIKGRIWTEGVRECDVEEDIWVYDGGIGRRVE